MVLSCWCLLLSGILSYLGCVLCKLEKTLRQEKKTTSPTAGDYPAGDHPASGAQLGGVKMMASPTAGDYPAGDGPASGAQLGGDAEGVKVRSGEGLKFL